MTDRKNGVSYRLKEATLITGASWVVHLERHVGQWNFQDSYKLTKTRVSELGEYLNRSSVDSWLCGALGSRSSRSRAVPGEFDLGCERLFAFPIAGSTGVLLVGATEPDKVAQRVWKLVTSTLSTDEAEDLEVSPVVTDTLVPAIQEGVPFDLPVALDRILSSIAQQVPCQGTWLAVRSGDTLEIQSHWRTPQCKGVSLGLDTNMVLREVSKTTAGLRFDRGDSSWDNIPQVGLKSTTGSWGACLWLLVSV